VVAGVAEMGKTRDKIASKHHFLIAPLKDANSESRTSQGVSRM
jgi:hypothetical protein